MVADIDECNKNLDKCTALQLCINTPGSFTCVCKKGYRMTSGKCEGIITPYLSILIMLHNPDRRETENPVHQRVAMSTTNQVIINNPLRANIFNILTTTTPFFPHLLCTKQERANSSICIRFPNTPAVMIHNCIL